MTACRAPGEAESVMFADCRGWLSVSGHPLQTAPGAKANCGQVTVTMPVHPFNGMVLRVVREERDWKAGHRYVVVEHPGAGHLRLPEEWTDRSPQTPPAMLEGHQVRLSARGLIRLAAAIEVVLGKELDPSSGVSTLGKQAGRARGIPAGGMVRPVGDDAAEAARGVGHARPQSAASRRRSRGPR